MTWPKIVLLAWYAVAAVVSIAQIGKDRRPTTPGGTAIAVVLMAGIATLVVIA
ncbi:MAG: hypothetical protein FWH11_01375 [Micrococcales bacterium]|nr:hypothetical protein [Micrococcales bacterium]